MDKNLCKDLNAKTSRLNYISMAEGVALNGVSSILEPIFESNHIFYLQP